MTGVKVILKTKKDGIFVDYEAKIGDAMEMSGYTRGGKDEVKQIIRRALRAEKPLPNRVKEISIDIGEYSDLHISARLRYEADKGWVAELFATLDGFDGFADAWHRIVKKVELGKRLDGVVTGLLLQMNLLNAAKYAYNIYVEDDDESDYFDDDYSDDDDGSTSLKIQPL